MLCPAPHHTYLSRERYADPYPRIDKSGFTTETVHVLPFGRQHASFVHVPRLMQVMYTTFLKARGWERFFEAFEV